MKWMLLIVIVLAVVIAFGLWRRSQGGAKDRHPSRPAAALEQPDHPATLSTAPAAEAGADEVTGAPASETRPPGHPDDGGAADTAADWWPDSGSTPPEARS